jgi:hypothetical protein
VSPCALRDWQLGYDYAVDNRCSTRLYTTVTTRLNHACSRAHLGVLDAAQPGFIARTEATAAETTTAQNAEELCDSCGAAAALLVGHLDADTPVSEAGAELCQLLLSQTAARIQCCSCTSLASVVLLVSSLCFQAPAVGAANQQGGRRAVST